MSLVNYNERSWAIDVISHINIFLNQRDKKIKGASGENTIKNNKSSLFPDVLLFGDKDQGEILQGWELKMPDTAINDPELISNAILKANILKLDSFLLWNVKSAVLYSRDINKQDVFEILHSWDDISINKRSDVKENEILWKELLNEILETLFIHFDNGDISGRQSSEVLSLSSVIDIILENTNATVQEIKNKAASNSLLNAEINSWWRSSANEYPNFKSAGDKYKVLARVVLTDWVIKIIFGHTVKNYFDEAKRIDQINFETDLETAISILNEITETCNFWNIFSINIGQNALPEIAWNQIVQLNTFLLDLNVAGINVEILHEILQSSINTAKRRVAGQFSTPVELADLLARLTISDKSKTVIDPCCGTGTIISAAAKLKEEFQVSNNQIIDTVWASDKYAFPIQLATLTLSQPVNLGKILKVFRHDVIDLNVGKRVDFKDPNNGETITVDFPQIDYVVSNLPFIQQEDIRHLNPNIAQINNWISSQVATDLQLDGRSDIYTYIPFYLYRLLSNQGQIGIIVSNAWLGTSYGSEFIQLFQYFYEIKHVVISAKGKWFENAAVVTTIIVAQKRNAPSLNLSNQPIGFHSLNSSLEEFESMVDVSDDIILNNSTEEVTSVTYTNNQIERLGSFGLSWSSLFVDLNWILNLEDKFISASSIFNIGRGERRGWNDMFYPPLDGHGIEEIYIRPVLKNLKGADARGLTCSPNKIAFCCSEDIETLEANNHTGALNWIRSFENLSNKNGRPLPIALARPGSRWYEMRAETMADFVANINFDKSLFISRLESSAFVDQRLIRFTFIDNLTAIDRSLIHCLMNSVMSMFFIEALGFGRGLGALDLNKKKVEENYKILNPSLLSDESKSDIISAFQPLLNRNRLSLEDEVESADRQNFEKIVFEAFDISDSYLAVKSALIQLYRIRQAVNS